MNPSMKLLVIDDDEVDRLQLKRALKTSGFDCQLTESEGIENVSEITQMNSFDCIFLDYLLPADNGLSLLKKIRDKGINTPVVIITSQGNENIAVELMKAGASDYIVKNNINAQAIGQVLRNILRMSLVEKERQAAEQALKLSELRLVESRDLNEQSMKVREIFLSNMSHEIRTPMNAILGFTNLLYDTPLTAEQKTFLDAIHFSGENLLVIINDILDLSKIKSGKMTIDSADFHLDELLKGIITLLQPKAIEKGLAITYRIDSHVSGFIHGDRVRLNQILVNLISNAVKFTKEGSVHLEVRTCNFGDGKPCLEFIVSDTGIGIAEDKHALIFDSFQQASSDTTRNYGGSGLGLTIVKSLVESQGGDITLVSRPGQGSSFTVRLPFIQAATTVSSDPRKGPGAPKTLRDLEGVSILIVEDNALNQLLARKVLEQAGGKTDVASNGRIALEKLVGEKYDVILMDIQMPEMDGYETTRHIRKLPLPLSEIPIIAMTAHAFVSEVHNCIAAGMNDYISKPFKKEILISKIVKCIASKETINLYEATKEIAKAS